MKTPILSMEKAEDFENAIKELIPSYLPEWKPTEGEVGWAVAKSFSTMSEQIATQLNKVPNKLFLSYLNQLGFEPKEAELAQTPVTFTLRQKGVNSVRIPQKSQLMSQAKAVFETQNEFTAQKAKVMAAYYVDGQKDSIVDIWSELEAKKDAHFDSPQSLQSHELYIKDDKLFLFKRTMGRGQYVHLLVPYLKDARWFYWGTDNQEVERWIAFEKCLNEKKEHTCLSKSIASASMSTTVNGETGYWIKATIPKISQSISIENFSIQFNSRSGLDASFTNDVPINLKKTFYPFGKEPQLEDAWYLASDEAFSKSGHLVTLYFRKLALLNNPKNVSLSWEYNNGKTWQKLNISYVNNSINFIVPDEINLFEQNSIKSYWIRLRIVAGGYAQTSINKTTVKTTEVDNVSTFEITQNSLTTTYEAPTLTFKYISVKGVNEAFKNVIINHNHNYQKYNYMPNTIFPKTDKENKVLYLGFDHPFDSGLVSLFFALTMRQLKMARTLNCSYADTYWKKLKIEDETQALQKNGTLSFLAPDSQKEETLFGTLGYWIKIELLSHDSQLLTKASTKKRVQTVIQNESMFDIPLGDNDKGDVLTGIYANTVWAKHSHGGKRGVNGEAYSVDKLISNIPAIKEVINPLAITGGTPSQSNEALILKAPSKIRHRNAAITQQDIEALVYEVSNTIVRVKLFLSIDGKGEYRSGGNTIVLLPFLNEPMPKPSFSLRQKVEDYLASRLSAVSSFEVIAPEYVQIDITAILHTKTIAYVDRIQEETIKGLNAYLHPLTGKSNGLGWNFGEALCLSDLIGWLEQIKDVEYVSQIEITLRSKNNRMTLSNSKNRLITLPPYALIASGLHQIKVEEI